jgi:hypothetical protein
MYADLIGYENGLVSLWNFNEGDGDFTYDQTGNNNVATVYNGSWSNDVPQPPYLGPEWFVSEGGSNDNNGSSDYPFGSIQHAINYANNGDSVFVGPGTYAENLNLSGKNVSLTSTDGPESTIIDGNQNGRVITLDNPGNNDIYNRISGFTIQNGFWSGAGAGNFVFDTVI